MGTPHPTDKEKKNPPARRPRAGSPKHDPARTGQRPPPASPAPRQSAAPAPTLPDYQQRFKELVARANQGERLAVDRLRAFLDLNPNLWGRAGDLTTIAERAWVELITGADQFRIESVQRRLARLKADLQGPSPTPLEALLVDLVGVAWLGTHHAEIQAASPAGGSLDQAAFRLRRAESAQKRLLTAARTLATLRALVPQGLVPAQPLRLHDPKSKLG